MKTDDRTPGRSIGRYAGGLYLSLVPLGIISFVVVPSRVVVLGDAAATASNTVAKEWLFRMGSASHQLSEVIVVLQILRVYRLFRSVNAERAMAMVVLALLCVPISVVAEVNALGGVELLAGSRQVNSDPSLGEAEP